MKVHKRVTDEILETGYIRIGDLYMLLTGEIEHVGDVGPCARAGFLAPKGVPDGSAKGALVISEGTLAERFAHISGDFLELAVPVLNRDKKTQGLLTDLRETLKIEDKNYEKILSGQLSDEDVMTATKEDYNNFSAWQPA